MQNYRQPEIVFVPQVFVPENWQSRQRVGCFLFQASRALALTRARFSLQYRKEMRWARALCFFYRNSCTLLWRFLRKNAPIKVPQITFKYHIVGKFNFFASVKKECTIVENPAIVENSWVTELSTIERFYCICKWTRPKIARLLDKDESKIRMARKSARLKIVFVWNKPFFIFARVRYFKASAICLLFSIENQMKWFLWFPSTWNSSFAMKTVWIPSHYRK